MVAPPQLLLSLCTVALALGDRECESGFQCKHKDECPGFTTARERWQALTRGTPEYSSALTVLRELVCQGTTRVCCRITLPSTDGDCGRDKDCVALNYCPAFLEDRKRLTQLTQGSHERNQLLSQLRQSVCNSKSSGVCCLGNTQSVVTPPTRRPRPSPSTTSNSCDPLEGDCLPGLGKCGLGGDSQFIVNGENTKPGEFPSFALLGRIRKRRIWVDGVSSVVNINQWTCGGTLINRRYVLTAAHCHSKTNKRKQISLVRLGEFLVTDDNGQDCNEDGICLPKVQDFTIDPSDVSLHPEYASKLNGVFLSPINDIALIRLPRPAEINTAVHVVCLPYDPTIAANSINVPNIKEGLVSYRPTVVGYGHTEQDPFDRKSEGKQNRVASQVQQKLAIPVLSDSDCSGKMQGWAPLESQICAGGEEGKDSCSGDSGGPLYVKKFIEGEKVSETYGVEPWYLLGIVSFGSRTCGAGNPGVYTRVQTYIPWIRNIIKK